MVSPAISIAVGPMQDFNESIELVKNEKLLLAYKASAKPVSPAIIPISIPTIGALTRFLIKLCLFSPFGTSKFKPQE